MVLMALSAVLGAVTFQATRFALAFDAHGMRGYELAGVRHLVLVTVAAELGCVTVGALSPGIKREGTVLRHKVRLVGQARSMASRTLGRRVTRTAGIHVTHAVRLAPLWTMSHSESPRSNPITWEPRNVAQVAL